jgi:hypothetical protein
MDSIKFYKTLIILTLATISSVSSASIGKMYWSDVNQEIPRSNLYGTEIETSMVPAQNFIGGFSRYYDKIARDKLNRVTNHAFLWELP